MPSGSKSTRFPGVYAVTGKTMVNGKPDVTFFYTIQQNGKKVWIKAGKKSEGMTASVAAQMRAAALAERRADPLADVRPKKAITFTEGAEYYLANYLPSGSKNCKCWTSKHLIPFFNGKLMRDIDAATVRGLKNHLVSIGLAPASVKMMLGIVSRIFNVCNMDKMIALENPCKSVAPPKVQNARIRYLTRDEARMLLAALKKRSPTWHDLAALSLWTGARLGELLSLHVRSVDLDGGAAQVDGKTGRRMIHLNAPARALLAERMRGKAPDDLLFPPVTSRNTVGHHCVTHNVFNKICLEIGLNSPDTPRENKVVFHSLRHTFASHLAIAGVPLYVISQLLGHHSLIMTQRYAHLCPDSKKSAVDIMAGIE